MANHPLSPVEPLNPGHSAVCAVTFACVMWVFLNSPDTNLRRRIILNVLRWGLYKNWRTAQKRFLFLGRFIFVWNCLLFEWQLEFAHDCVGAISPVLMFSTRIRSMSTFMTRWAWYTFNWPLILNIIKIRMMRHSIYSIKDKSKPRE